MLQADVQNGCGVGQSAAGDEVHAQVADLLDVLPGDVAGTLGLGPAVDDADGLGHVLVAHVVQHDDVGTGLYGLPDHVQVLYLHLDLPDEGGVGPGHLHGLLHAACGVDVVVLQHDAVGQVVAVVGAAAQTHGVLLEDAHAGSGFPGVQQGGVGALQQVGHGPGVGGDAAEALQVVQGGALTGEQHPDVALHCGHVLAGNHMVAVLHVEDHFGLGVQQGEDPLKDLQTGDDAVLLADQIHLAGLCLRHDGVGGDVLAVDILFQGKADVLIRHKLHGNGVHDSSSFHCSVMCLAARSANTRLSSRLLLARRFLP